jgi:hypothetical protein
MDSGDWTSPRQPAELWGFSNPQSACQSGATGWWWTQSARTGLRGQKQGLVHLSRTAITAGRLIARNDQLSAGISATQKRHGPIRASVIQDSVNIEVLEITPSKAVGVGANPIKPIKQA